MATVNIPKEEDFPTNSFKSKQGAKTTPVEKTEKKKVEPVKLSSGIVQRKKPLLARFKDSFLGADAKEVGSYLFMDVAIPAAKTLISDLVTQGIERALYGESRGRPMSSRGGRGSYTSYNRMSRSTPPWEDQPRAMSRKGRASHDFDEIVLPIREEAEEILFRLRQGLEQYDVVSVSDLYDLVGITGSFTDNKWGWNDLTNAGVSRVRDGFLLDLPRPMELD